MNLRFLIVFYVYTELKEAWLVPVSFFFNKNQSNSRSDPKIALSFQLSMFPLYLEQILEVHSSLSSNNLKKIPVV